MCGRFTLETPIPEIARYFGVDLLPREELPARYNIAPTDPILAVRWTGRGEERELVYLHWGLIPRWVKDPGDWPTLINARGESLHRKPAFEEAVRDRRCIVVADGFYEWRREGGVKQPYYIRARSGEPLAFAALWDRWEGPAGEDVESGTIVTTDANELVRSLHDRMPVILSREGQERWLDPGVRSYADVEDLLGAPPSGPLVAYPVGRRVNRTDSDDPGLIEPLERGEPATGTRRGDGPPAPGEPSRRGAAADGEPRREEREEERAAGDRPAPERPEQLRLL